MPDRPRLICIDARWILPRISGIGRVTERIISHLGRREGPERYLLLFSDPSQHRLYSRLWADLEALEPVLVPWKIFSPAGQMALPRYLAARGVELFHSPNFFLPLGPGKTPMVTTIHDLIPLKFPQFTPRALKTRFHPLFRHLLRRCARRSRFVFTVSRHTASDLREDLGLSDEKIRVIPNGIDEVYRPLEPKQAEAGLPDQVRGIGPYILYVGRFDPYKNVPGLIRCFKQTADEVPEARLVVVGHRDPRYPEAFAEAGRLRLGKKIIFVDGASEEELVSLYNRARFLVLPSFYEGFGLPPLEAMACGTAVIVSNRASLPEVVGEAGIIVDAADESALARALTGVWRDDALRRDLGKRGRARARNFSWQRAAGQTLDAYREILGSEAER